jgi:deoxynucleoside triphosphate triphosphohydrolase SAMHD1
LNVPSDADAAVDASALRRGGRAKRLYNDMTFIEEIINGTPEAQRVGRDADKFFLYDIVNNLRSGLDVDKLDYFQRDMKMCNVFPMPVVTFDRFLELGLVLPATPIGAAEGLGPEHERLPKMICYPEKMASEALNLFAARFHMHQKVYQHKAVKQVEFMITEALALANPYIDIKGAVTSHHPKGLYKISECIYDMTAMSNLKDSVVDVIM